jgi:hypothetical protein
VQGAGRAGAAAAAGFIMFIIIVTVIIAAVDIKQTVGRAGSSRLPRRLLRRQQRDTPRCIRHAPLQPNGRACPEHDKTILRAVEQRRNCDIPPRITFPRTFPRI